MGTSTQQSRNVCPPRQRRRRDTVVSDGQRSIGLRSSKERNSAANIQVPRLLQHDGHSMSRKSERDVSRLFTPHQYARVRLQAVVNLESNTCGVTHRSRLHSVPQPYLPRYHIFLLLPSLPYLFCLSTAYSAKHALHAPAGNLLNATSHASGSLAFALRSQ